MAVSQEKKLIYLNAKIFQITLPIADTNVQFFNIILRESRYNCFRLKFWMCNSTIECFKIDRCPIFAIRCKEIRWPIIIDGEKFSSGQFKALEWINWSTYNVPWITARIRIEAHVSTFDCWRWCAWVWKIKPWLGKQNEMANGQWSNGESAMERKKS